ncbi:MAG: S-layer homology domain-containing protein [Chloroflexi bacterium]|nr:S-layer homology domain-containing protein [Chloroflexota bacterium]
MKFHLRAISLAILPGLVFAFPGASISQAATPPNNTSPLGTNSDFMVYWASEWEFVDAFKSSRPWISQCNVIPNPPQTTQPDCTWGNAWDTGESNQIDLDPDGWVRSLPAPEDAPIFWIVGTTMFGGNTNGHYPSGQYILLYDGEGTLEYGYDAAFDASLSTTGRDVLNVTPTQNGIWIKITETDPNHTGNYIRNIRVIMPGYESTYASQVFHPTFLNLIQKYKVFRFKDWMATDGSIQPGDWDSRPKQTDARWTAGQGVPLETMIELSNRMKMEPWFNMPHTATDDYITQFATLTRDTLDPSLKVYIEYSNEVWNSNYPFSIEAMYAQQQGNAMWPSSPASAFTKQINWFGLRTAQMCDIWKNAWGAQSGRVVCVMGAHFNNPWTASQALDCPLWTEGAPCSGHGIDAVAVGAYFGGYLGNAGYHTEVAGWASSPNGLDQLFIELQTGGVLTGGPTGGGLQNALDYVTQHVNIASVRGVEVVAYEGGHHLFDTQNDPAVRTLFDNASHDPRMGALYTQYLDGWRANGGGLFVNFKNVAAPGSYGSMGALDYMDQTSSYRYDALMDFIDNNSCWWANCADITAPTANSIVRANPNPTSAASVDFTVTFTESVTGVDTTDFAITATGVTGASILTVSGSGNIYTVSADTGSGSGSIRLDILDDDSITDGAGSSLGGSGIGNGNFTGGQTYDIVSASFSDVPASYWAWAYIESLYRAGITGGCSPSPLMYCPEDNVTRAQMAIFLEKGLNGSSFIPPIVPITFTDTPGHWAQYWIEALKADGVTSGCGAGIYCPEASVTRAQMAVFLLKSKHGASYSPPPAAGTMFSDVPPDYWAAAWIEQLASEGITSGCGAGVYCPDSPVTRAQMAVFLVKTFNLP